MGEVIAFSSDLGHGIEIFIMIIQCFLKGIWYLFKKLNKFQFESKFFFSHEDYSFIFMQVEKKDIATNKGFQKFFYIGLFIMGFYIRTWNFLSPFLITQLPLIDG